MTISKQFVGYHSEWNLGSPGGWDYQRIAQKIGKEIWSRLLNNSGVNLDLDFDHPLLHPIHGFINMLRKKHYSIGGTKREIIAVVAEEETLQDVTENRNLVTQLNSINGISSVLMSPNELELIKGHVCWHGIPISVIFMDFNTNVLVSLHRKYNLYPLLQALCEGKVINPPGTAPINAKSMFEVITDLRNRSFFCEETIKRTPWTRQFFPRRTKGPNGENIPDLIEWTRSNWGNLVLKPERGYSGKGVYVGGIHCDVDNIIDLSLKEGEYGGYIVQQKIPLNLWAEYIPELDFEKRLIRNVQCQTDFRCFFGNSGVFGFLGRYGGVPTNVGSGGGMQPLAVLRSQLNIDEATKRINNAILGMDYDYIFELVEDQKKMAMEYQFTYLLGPIKIALRPRLITAGQIDSLGSYCDSIWSDCIKLEQMWLNGDLDLIENIDADELEVMRSRPWRGTPAIFASDGLFSFGAHLK